MSTHVKKKENFFYTQENQIQEDIDEFPSGIPEQKQRKTDHTKNIDDDSSLYKYKEYKKIYFDDPKQKKNSKIIESNYATEQNKYTKLLNTHFNKATKKSGSKDKGEYFDDKGDKSSKRESIKFDVLSSEPKSNASKRAQNNLKKYGNVNKEHNIIDSIVQKHIKNKSKYQQESPAKDTPPVVYQYTEKKKREEPKNDGSEGSKSGSLVSFEYNCKDSQSNLYKNRESSNRNESYEIRPSRWLLKITNMEGTCLYFTNCPNELVMIEDISAEVRLEEETKSGGLNDHGDSTLVGLADAHRNNEIFQELVSRMDEHEKELWTPCEPIIDKPALSNASSLTQLEMQIVYSSIFLDKSVSEILEG